MSARIEARIVATFTDDVLRGAKYPARSTSPTSNLMEQEEVAAKAKFLDDIRYF